MSQIQKCKICGDTEFIDLGDDIIQCRSCRHKSQKPKQNAELLERANSIRFDTKDFDQAMSLYEEIIRMTPDEAEAYWGLVLCRYGIEYVQDSDGRYLPTCHRTIETSILDDGDYKMVLSKASYDMMEYYINEAKTIDEYQKKIKAIAQQEEPYDVFISFKATENGVATPDSLIAQELYYYLTKNLNLKVFFSNVTLKDKAGQEYEPIIYAALSSATVMIVVGTDPKYINSTWVKNEWSRYCRMATEDHSKPRYIIAALHGMRPEQLPSVLASRQAVDISELGAKEKLCSNIDSLIGDLRVSQEKKNAAPAFTMEDVKNNILNSEAENLCNSGFQKLSVGDFNGAQTAFDKAIDKKYDISRPYWGKLLADYESKDEESLSSLAADIKTNQNYISAYKFASDKEKNLYELCALSCHGNKEAENNVTELKNLNQAFDESYKYQMLCDYNNVLDGKSRGLFHDLEKNKKIIDDNPAQKANHHLSAKKSFDFGASIFDLSAVIIFAIAAIYVITLKTLSIDSLIPISVLLGLAVSFRITEKGLGFFGGLIGAIKPTIISAIVILISYVLRTVIKLSIINIAVSILAIIAPIVVLVMYINGRREFKKSLEDLEKAKLEYNQAQAAYNRLKAEIPNYRNEVMTKRNRTNQIREKYENLAKPYGGIMIRTGTDAYGYPKTQFFIGKGIEISSQPVAPVEIPSNNYSNASSYSESGYEEGTEEAFAFGNYTQALRDGDNFADILTTQGLTVFDIFVKDEMHVNVGDRLVGGYLHDKDNTEVILTSPVSGTIEFVDVEEVDTCEAGDLICCIELDK